MAKILHISASPKKQNSASLRLAEAFVARYSALNPDDEIEHLDLFDTAMPEFGADHATAKFALIYGETLSDGQAKAWQEINAVVTAFASADKIILSTPMWNYSVPWPLKRYLDGIMQPGLTFGYDPQKMVHIGLLKNRPVQFILTRSSTMPGDYADFQLPYLRYAFSAMGLNDLRVLCAWQTTQPSSEARADYVERFVAQAQEMAERF